MENREPKRLYRSSTDTVLTGVCGGLAEYSQLDPTIVRLLCVILSLLTAGVGAIVYIVAAFIMPVKE